MFLFMYFMHHEMSKWYLIVTASRERALTFCFIVFFNNVSVSYNKHMLFST